MGLKVGEVKIEKWNPEWQINFQEERRKLQEVFGKLALDIQHVGSTSIDGLSAKPIIDIAVGLDKLSDFEKVRGKFYQLLGYSVKENNEPNEILIRKGSDENRTAFIHVMEYDGERMRQTIRFRDILRSDPKVRNDYEKLKIDLAKRFPHERKKYSASKDDFIQSVLRNYGEK